MRNFPFARFFFTRSTVCAIAYKLGVEYSKFLLKGNAGFNGQGIKSSVSLVYEKFDNVPGAMHDEIAKLGVKFEYKVNQNVTVPLSITWVNHEDLLSDEDEVVNALMEVVYASFGR